MQHRSFWAVGLFCLTLLFYTVTNYGGIRSPDSEIVFRVCESLESHFQFSVSAELENWEGFGVAKGREGNLYAIFGPGESLFCIPFLKLAKYLNTWEWYRAGRFHIPVSHYIHDGLTYYMYGKQPPDLAPHALRFLVSFSNAVVSAAGVLVFWLILARMVSAVSAGMVTILYAFGTLAWPYAGTFFSEPLATLFVLLAFYGLIRYDPHFPHRIVTNSSLGILLAGMSLGLAVATHITAILFAPFWLFLCGYVCVQQGRAQSRGIHSVALFLLGLGIVLGGLGYYNFIRFGSIFETGRTISLDPHNLGYGHFVLPWRGLYGLLLSSGKGLLLFSPAILLGIFSWPLLHRQHPVLSLVLGGTALARWFFIAARSDWHGGFSLGPRYLVMLLPFLLLPIGFWLDTQLQQTQRKGIGLFGLCTFVCIGQQLYFCLGEIFYYYHVLKWNYAQRGIDIFFNDRIYLDWQLSPLLHLLQGRKGPFLLQRMAIDNIILWGLAMAIAGGLFILGFALLWPQLFRRELPTATKRSYHLDADASGTKIAL